LRLPGRLVVGRTEPTVGDNDFAVADFDFHRSAHQAAQRRSPGSASQGFSYALLGAPRELAGEKGGCGTRSGKLADLRQVPRREKCGHRLGAAAKTNSDPRRCASGVAYAANGPVGLNGTIQGYVSIIVEPLKQEHPILSRVESMSTTEVGDFPEVTSPVAGISTDLLTETRLARTAAGFLVNMTRTPPKIDLPCGN
jgi:hypothetical protein